LGPDFSLLARFVFVVFRIQKVFGTLSGVLIVYRVRFSYCRIVSSLLIPLVMHYINLNSARQIFLYKTLLNKSR
jgi:hypothetical protein